MSEFEIIANEKLNRRSDIDFLRALGFLLIVLAHVGNAPVAIMQLRNFDVVLMVIVMGMSFSLGGGGGGITDIEIILLKGLEG